MNHNKSSLHGIVLVASGAVGAGMFSLPIVAAGMWFTWTTLGLGFIWLLNLCVALILLETNLKFSSGSSFSTLVGESLGRSWNIINNVAVAFVMYILMYAYFSAAGSIASGAIVGLINLSYLPSDLLEFANNRRILGLVFGFLMMTIIWFGTHLVSRICILLLLAMGISFSLSLSGLLLQADLGKLFLDSPVTSELAPFIWAALPYFVTSFACSGLVPSLVKFYGHDQRKIKNSLVWGTFLSLLVYLVWIIANFGNLTRNEMAPIITAGGNMGDLSLALQSKLTNDALGFSLGLFSNFAITTSFLSIGLGLFDYIADSLGIDNSATGRFKTALITFLPPAIFSFLYPKGFILAIGYAGLVVLFSFYVIPILMAMRLRSQREFGPYQFFGGVKTLSTLLLLSLTIAGFKLLASFDLLAVFPS